MALSKMQSAALYTLLLLTLTLILNHEMDRSSYATIYAWDDPAWRNLTRALEARAALDGTVIDPAAPFDEERGESFYRSLPQRVFVYAMLVPLRLYWNVGLDYVFPARVEGLYEKKELEKSLGEKLLGENERREDEVVKHGMRSSVSWRNTFFKWILDITGRQLLSMHSRLLSFSTSAGISCPSLGFEFTLIVPRRSGL
jgi:hypothetical protein